MTSFVKDLRVDITNNIRYPIWKVYRARMYRVWSGDGVPLWWDRVIMWILYPWHEDRRKP